MTDQYDVVVIGGGAAGLSGALTLARARRTVLVVDAGQQRNNPADHVHNYLGREGAPPAELAEAGRAEVTGYGGEIVPGRVESAVRDGDRFAVTLADGRRVRARRLLLAVGLVDQLPDLPGLAQHWGGDVVHCPYCHGWEVRDRRIGVLAVSSLALHQAELWRQWTPNLLLLLNGQPDLDPEQAERFAARGIVVVPEPVVALETAHSRLTGVRLDSGETVALEVLAIGTGLTARGELFGSLGLTPVDVEFGGQVIGSQLRTDPTGATDVPGVWAAGNVADVLAQAIVAAAAGLKAGAMINFDLVAEDGTAAVEHYREQIRTIFERDAWEQRYQARPSIWSGNPNPQLVAEATDLPAGRALDVGSGEGADAIWLAARGWRVTATDISTTALERAATHARTAGDEVAARITWLQADLREQPPAAAGFDLVSAQFMHLPGEPRRELFARLAAAVAPGGTLLIVGHHPSDLRTTAARMHFPEMMYTAEEVAAALDPGHWQVLTTAARPRTATDLAGNEIAIQDAVLVARRRG